MKASTAKFAAEELITKREEAKARIGDVIRATFARGIITEQVFITDFQFSNDFVKAVESKVVAIIHTLDKPSNYLYMSNVLYEHVVIINSCWELYLRVALAVSYYITPCLFLNTIHIFK